MTLQQELTALKLDGIKDRLLCYLLKDVEENFEHLTVKERAIIGDIETFTMLLESIGINQH
jgi:hypothetical protein|tara:strand:+ start:194 stop:376 length:183 start_codon:yes stop_codon:yes gene_type:complete